MDDEITYFIPMKYKIFFGKGQRPLATPAWDPVQPCGPRDHLSVCFLRSQIAPTPTPFLNGLMPLAGIYVYYVPLL